MSPIFKVIALSASLLFIPDLQAEKVTLETLYTCQQDDGDQWIEAGLRINDGPGYELIVVAHNDDDGSAILVDARQVFKTKNPDALVFEDNRRTARLEIRLPEALAYNGRLVFLVDGPGSIKLNQLNCYPNSEISFERSP